jgi:DNA polymerase III alpha subunit (gram-positive type)
MRQIVLDTETTGLSTGQGHRIIEIGAIELVNRRLTGRDFHRFLNPDRDIDEGAERVHGISRADLETAPRFHEVADELLDFINGCRWRANCTRDSATAWMRSANATRWMHRTATCTARSSMPTCWHACTSR